MLNPVACVDMSSRIRASGCWCGRCPDLGRSATISRRFWCLFEGCARGRWRAIGGRCRHLVSASTMKSFMSKPVLNERLWFLHLGCTGQHFILGNPHTCPGRMLAWCERKERFFFSKSEVEQCSAESAAWMEGFLAGNKPEPPIGADGDVEFESNEYESWLSKVEAFRRSGVWQKGQGSEGSPTSSGR